MQNNIIHNAKSLRTAGLAAMLLLIATGSTESAISSELTTVRPFKCGTAKTEMVMAGSDPDGMGPNYRRTTGYSSRDPERQSKYYCRLTNLGEGKCGCVVYHFLPGKDGLFILGSGNGELRFRGAHDDSYKALKFKFILKPDPKVDKYTSVELKGTDLAFSSHSIVIDQSRIKVSEGLKNLDRLCIYLDQKGTADLGHLVLKSDDGRTEEIHEISLDPTDCGALEDRQWNAK